jgi:hypothetical protein
VFIQSTYGGPFLVSFVRSDGSLTFAEIREADITDDRFTGDVAVTYTNGEHGILTENGGDAILYIRTGKKETGRIADRVISGIRLADGSILPVKFTKATIRDGALVGDFHFVSFVGQVQGTGTIDPLGKLTAMNITPTIAPQDPAAVLAAQELLKLNLSITGEDNNNVLGVTSATDSSTGTVLVGSNSSVYPSVISSAIVAQVNTDEATVRLTNGGATVGAPGITGITS